MRSCYYKNDRWNLRATTDGLCGPLSSSSGPTRTKRAGRSTRANALISRSSPFTRESLPRNKIRDSSSDIPNSARNAPRGGRHLNCLISISLDSFYLSYCTRSNLKNSNRNGSIILIIEDNTHTNFST